MQYQNLSLGIKYRVDLYFILLCYLFYDNPLNALMLLPMMGVDEKRVELLKQTNSNTGREKNTRKEQNVDGTNANRVREREREKL